MAGLDQTVVGGPQGDGNVRTRVFQHPGNGNIGLPEPVPQGLPDPFLDQGWLQAAAVKENQVRKRRIPPHKPGHIFPVAFQKPAQMPGDGRVCRIGQAEFSDRPAIPCRAVTVGVHNREKNVQDC